MPIDDLLRAAMQTLDIGRIAPPAPAHSDLFHFEVVVNPHDPARRAYVTTMYKLRNYTSDYVKPALSPSGMGPGDDVLGIMGDVSNRLPGLPPAPGDSHFALRNAETADQ
jgi:hypothetical protein